MRWPLWRVAVAERSMEPALLPGDWLLVRRPCALGGRCLCVCQVVMPAIRPGRECCWSSGPPAVILAAGGWFRTTLTLARWTAARSDACRPNWSRAGS